MPETAKAHVQRETSNETADDIAVKTSSETSSATTTEMPGLPTSKEGPTHINLTDSYRCNSFTFVTTHDDLGRLTQNVAAIQREIGTLSQSYRRLDTQIQDANRLPDLIQN